MNPLFAAVRWTLLALSVIRGAAPFLVAIGGKADIGGDLARNRLSAFDPERTLAVHCGNGLDARFSPYQCARLSR
jgi:hypothetical protein